MQNLTTSIKNAVLGKGVSKKSDYAYTYIDITFSNDYTLRTFLTDEQKFIVTSLFAKPLAPTKKIDIDLSDDESDLGGFLDA